MTITEALEYARRELEAYRLKVADRPFYQREVEYLEIVVEALEKQIPKKPEYTKTNTPYCPVCGDLLAEDFCGECGQAIDWESDTE